MDITGIHFSYLATRELNSSKFRNEELANTTVVSIINSIYQIDTENIMFFKNSSIIFTIYYAIPNKKQTVNTNQGSMNRLFSK